MATSTDYITGVKCEPQPSGQEVISVVCTLTPTAGEVATGGVLKLFDLPAGCVPVRYTLINADLGTSAPADLGILTAAGTAVSTAAADGGAKWITAQDLGTAAITLSTASSTAASTLIAVTPTTTNRTIGIVFGTVSGGASGAVTLMLEYKAAN